MSDRPYTAFAASFIALFYLVADGKTALCLAADAANAAPPGVHVKNAAPRTRHPKAYRLHLDLKAIRERDAALAKAGVSNDFENPPLAPNKKNGFELVLAKHRFLIPGTLPNKPCLPQHFELLWYENHERRAVGPTIRIQLADGQGATFRIHLKNRIPGCCPCEPPPPTNDPLTSETPNGFCDTNLHTHGLHVSPSGSSDNIFRSISPGDDFVFEYTIAANHPSGTFWYHAHKHGAVAYQLSNGLAGALIVERKKATKPNPPNATVKYHDDIYDVARAREKVMVIQLLTYRPKEDDGDARIDASTIYNIPPTATSCGAIKVTGPVPPGDPPQVTLLNGALIPTIKMKTGEVQRWRIIQASWDELKPLALEDESGKPLQNPFKEIALDGLATKPRMTSVLYLAPGQRSDVLVQAPAAGTYYLSQTAVDNEHALKRGTDKLYLAKIVVSPLNPAKDKNVVTNFPPDALLEQCALSTTLSGTVVKPPRELQDGIHMNGVDINQTYNINWRTFHRFDHDIPVERDTIQEWEIKAAPPINDWYPPPPADPTQPAQTYPNNHPFHVHVNPFLICKHLDACGKDFKDHDVGRWRDTVMVPGGHKIVIHMPVQDYLGRTVFHCHILDHEDQGMMVPIVIVPKGAKPLQPARLKLAPGADRAPALALPVAGAGNTCELAAYRNKHNVVLVFIESIHCSHCALELRRLMDALGKNLSTEEQARLTVLAVSSQPVRNPRVSRQILNLSEATRPPLALLVDATHRAFQDFGCYAAQQPLHGLFVIDRDGIIHARYVGPVAFDDPDAVVRALREIDIRANRVSSR